MLTTQASSQWQDINLVNWVSPKRYMAYDKTRLLTDSGNVYVYDSDHDSWLPDVDYSGYRISDIIHTERYEFLLPMMELRVRATGERLQLHESLYDSLYRNAAFYGDTLAIVNQNSFVVYDIRSREILHRVDFGGSMAVPYPIHRVALVRDTLYIMQDILHIISIDGTRIKKVFGDFGLSYLTPTTSEGIVGGSYLFSVGLLGIELFNIFTYEFRMLHIGFDPAVVIFSAMERDGWMYVAENYADQCRLFKVNIESGVVREIARLDSTKTTGIRPARIYSIHPEYLVLSDRNGGLFKYMYAGDDLVWHGNGLYEAPVYNVETREDRMLLWSNGGLFEYDGLKVRRLKNRFDNALGKPPPTMYKDSVITVAKTDRVLIQGYDVINSRYALDLFGTDVIVVNDSLLFISWVPYVYRYTSEGFISIFAKPALLASSEGRLFMWVPDGMLDMYEPETGTHTHFWMTSVRRYKLIDLSYSNRIAVLLGDGRVVAMNFETGQLLWERPATGETASLIHFRDHLLLVTRDGRFYRLQDGSLVAVAPAGIRQAVSFKGRCYLFYENNTIKVSDDSFVLSAPVADREALASSVELYPNPVVHGESTWLRCSAGSWHIAVHDLWGRQLHSTVFEASTASDRYRIALPQRGVYNITLSSTLHGERHSKRVIRY
jgi:outer membrane protein assembly factor BamB